MKKNKISVCMITWNVEKYLDESLRSVKNIADEIIIVDRFSTDNTLNIAKKYNARIIQKDLGFYESRKIAENNAKYPWIFKLDADEVLSENLQDEILDILERNDDIDGIRIPFYYIIRNHFTKYPIDNRLRIVRKDKSFLKNLFVHEHYEMINKDAKIITLRNPIFHYDVSSIANHLGKLNRYSDLEVKNLHKTNYVFKWHDIILRPLKWFFYLFIMKKGWKSGLRGLYISLYRAVYEYVALMKFWESDVRLHSPGTWKTIEAMLPNGKLKVLDVGGGGFTWGKDGYEVHSCDIIDVNKPNFKKCDLNEAFPYSDSEFDGVIWMEIFEHLENPRHFMRECKRIVKDNGFIILTTPNCLSNKSRRLFRKHGRFQWFSNHDYKSSGHITPIFRWQVDQICSELGLEIVDEKFNNRQQEIVVWMIKKKAKIGE